jgi:hypothetical protein
MFCKLESLVSKSMDLEALLWLVPRLSQTQIPESIREKADQVIGKISSLSYRFFTENGAAIAEAENASELSYLCQHTGRLKPDPSPIDCLQQAFVLKDDYRNIFEKTLNTSDRELPDSPLSAALILGDSQQSPELRDRAESALLDWSKLNGAKLVSLLSRSIELGLQFINRLKSSSGFQLRVLEDIEADSHSALVEEILANNNLFRETLVALTGSSPRKFRDTLNSFPGPSLISNDVKIETILSAFASVNVEYAQIIRTMYQNKAVIELDTKDPTFFCSTGFLSGIGPVVLVNAGNSTRDYSLLAHELGHAIHFQRLARSRGPLCQSSSKVLLESVAIFFSLVCSDELAKKYPELRSQIIAPHVTQLFQRSAGALFGSAMAQKSENTVLTLADVRAEWGAIQTKLYGSDYELGEFGSYWWGFSSWNMLTPLYQQEYVISPLIALKLLQVFNENPDRFSLLFDNVLCAGGSRSTADVLMSLGVDIYSSRLSRDGVAVLSQLMKGGL